MNARSHSFPLRGLVLAALALPLLAACAVLPSPGLQRAKAGEALFEDRCKSVAGIRIYKTVADVEGIVLLKVRPKAGEREWSDPMWPGAAFALEDSGENYINTFLGYEQALGSGSSWTPITPTSRGYINTTFSPGAPYNLPGYRYVDVVEEGTGARWRYSLAQKPRPTSKIGWVDTVLERQPAPVEGPRYGVMYDDHVIPEERALGLASSTVKVLDLKTNEVLGEMTMYSWTPSKPNPANPTPWLTARRCGSNSKLSDAKTRQFADQILLPRKDK
ncbi:hypothetical protein [Uliginosibacterium sp. TH139]|uniref:hypothetical protein n=1 Tax=Uliginosibacterium sp. TH139 TaxID=2067453 RepID=UPI000C7D9948|nr:hypothetical protein [Uliginosibacterium sp. TH139]PLK47612.1 hypothetical protein C0V76_16665 [Uliginosibacterium sp. TH139]